MRSAYDPETFRREAHAIVDQLADHLVRASAGELPVLPPAGPRASIAAWDCSFEGGADPLALFQRVIDGSNHLHHPGFVGHQVTAPVPIAGLAELVSGILNNGMAVYEMGPVSSAMELSLIHI